MKILAIETSCDETSAAIVEKKESETAVHVLSIATSSSLLEHAKTGGIIPEKAARRQLEYMLPVVEEALTSNGELKNARSFIKTEIDVISVTYSPGLIGSLLVGVETAKIFSYVFDKPLVPVNHLLAHLYANFIESNILSLRGEKRRSNLDTIQFPFIGLIVSGGHTDLLLFKNHGRYKWLGGTRDDACGEALDKIGRMLGLSYPGGPEIEKRAKKVEQTNLSFQSPLLHSDDYDFSYSGLKTEVIRYVQKELLTDKQAPELSETKINEICFAVQKAALDVLAVKTVKAAKEYNVKAILIGGGVAANEYLKETFDRELRTKMLKLPILFPEKKYTLDNAAMIGAYALLNYNPMPWEKVTAQPEVHFK